MNLKHAAAIVMAATLFSQTALPKYNHQNFVGSSYEQSQAHLYADGLAEALAIYTLGSTSESQLQISATLTAITNMCPGFLRLYKEAIAIQTKFMPSKLDGIARETGLSKEWEDGKAGLIAFWNSKSTDEVKGDKGIHVLGVGSKLVFDFVTHVYGIAKDLKKFSSAEEMAKANKQFGSHARKKRLVQFLWLATTYVFIPCLCWHARKPSVVCNSGQVLALDFSRTILELARRIHRYSLDFHALQEASDWDEDEANLNPIAQ